VVGCLAHHGGTTSAAFKQENRTCVSPINNWQEVHWCSMAKRTSPSEAQKRPYKTTGLHLPTDLWELLNRLAFEKACGGVNPTF
jgi:hypothetical protein